MQGAVLPNGLLRLGAIDGTAGVWARFRRASEMPVDRSANATGTAAKNARDLLRAAKGLEPPPPAGSRPPGG